MPLKITELKQLLHAINKNKVEKIYIQSSNIKILVNTVKYKKTLIPYQYNINIPTIQKTISKTEQNNSDPQNNILTNQEQNTYFTIVSPMIGTFYRSPAPNETPFIQINDKVQINQTVCIIEAMKLMNEIESEVNGYIVEILVEDGDIVDRGQALMRVQQQ